MSDIWERKIFIFNFLILYETFLLIYNNTIQKYLVVRNN
jgi:hypothetical protein